VVKYWSKWILIMAVALMLCMPARNSALAETVQSTVKATYISGSALIKSTSNVSKPTQGYISRFINEPLMLKGVDQAHDFYYMVPKADLGENNFIELDWSHSDLLVAAHSTLTVFVNDKPIKSVTLTGGANKTKIPLGPEEVTLGYHKVTLMKHSVVSDDFCVDQYNPANWVKFASSSYVFIDTKSNWTMEDPLKNYPYPFIEQGTPDEVYSTIVLPDSPSSELIASALRVSGYLSSVTASKKAIPVLTESEWAQTNKLTHVIAIGSVDGWKGVVKGFIDANGIKAESDAMALDYFSLTSNNATGEPKQMLLVTADKDAAIQQRVAAISDPNLVKQLTGSRLVVRDIPKPQAKDAEAKKTTLASFGFENLLLSDLNNDSDKMIVNLPSYWKLTGENFLTLKLKVSPLLMGEAVTAAAAVEDSKNKTKSKRLEMIERNGLTVTINGIPTTIALNDLEAVEKTLDMYTVKLPLAPYMQDPEKQGVLEMTFSANISNIGLACFPEQNTGRWLFIDKESVLTLPHELTKAPDFQNWPSPFVNDIGFDKTAFLVPKDLNGVTLSQLTMLVNDMVAQTDNRTDFAVIREPFGTEAEQLLKTHNIVVLGDLGQYESLKPFQDKLLIRSTNEQLQLAQYSIINETAEYAAWLQPSVWNKDLTMAVFQSTHPQDADKQSFLNPTLLQFLKTDRKNSQIAVMSKTSEVFAIDLKQPAAKPASGSGGTKSGASTEQGVISMPIWVWICIGAVFLGLLIAVVWLWRKEKRGSGSSRKE